MSGIMTKWRKMNFELKDCSGVTNLLHQLKDLITLAKIGKLQLQPIKNGVIIKFNRNNFDWPAKRG